MISAFIYKHDAASILDSNQSDIPSQCQDVEGVERDANSASSHKASVRCVSLHSTVASPSHMWRVPMILIYFLFNFFFLLWCWGRTQTLVEPGQDCQWTAPLVLTMSVFMWPPVVKLRHVSEVCGLLRTKSGKSHNKQKTQVWEWRALQRECNPSRDRGFVHYSKRQEPKTLRA